MEKIDLHLHTTYSDGDLDITTLLLEAKKIQSVKPPKSLVIGLF